MAREKGGKIEGERMFNLGQEEGVVMEVVLEEE